VRQNIKLFKKELQKFLISSTEIDKNKGKTKLFSYLFKTNNIEISKFTDSKLIECKTFFYWQIFEENEEFLGIDPIFKISELGEERLNITGKLANSLENKIISNWENYNLSNIPLFMGGIKFAPNQTSERWKDYSDSDWFIPRILFLKNQEGSFIVCNFLARENSFFNIEAELDQTFNFLTNLFDEKINDLKKANFVNPVYSNSINTWKNQVESALQKISEGQLNKVVLSREVNQKLTIKPSINILLEELGKKYPRCYIYAYKKGESIFIGASPEKLAKFSNGWIEIDALAGSAPRGKTNEEDLKFEQFLFNSEKNLNEQQSVVNFITSLIENISEEIYYDEKPVIRKLPNIQHLWTPIKAKLNQNYKLFDVLLKLHPTPAICGTPWDSAQQYILDVEQHDRGLYSGNIGWFNLDGNGEFAVAIRSALIKNTEIYAYSGCGIVEGSEPQSEFEESEIKLKPILSLFIDEKIYQS
jgi:menaquinone-specific isochorismate synthase